MAKCLIGLGANLGHRSDNLRRAISLLNDDAELQVVDVSSWRDYAAIGGPAGQQSFLNGAATLQTSLNPFAVCARLHAIEEQVGRMRAVRWDARTLDLDLLLYDDQIVDDPQLQIPHPRMITRRFVLEPAAEIAAHMVHPVTGWTVQRLLQHLELAKPYFAITGSERQLVRHVATRVAGETGARLIDVVERDADSPSSFQQHELELARRRYEATDLFDEERTQPCVTAFWLEQSVAFARALLSDHELARFRQQMPRANTVPKLVILLAGSPAHVAGEAQSREAAERDQLQAELKRQMRSPTASPWLTVDAVKHDVAVQEAVAAVTSMS